MSYPIVSLDLKCADCAMRRQGICGLLSAATQIRLARIASIQTFSAHVRVGGADCGHDLVGVLVSGYLRTQCHRIDGHRQIISLALPGDFVTEPAGRLQGEVEAATPARLCRFERRAFRRLLEDAPDLARAVYALRVAKLDQLRLLTWSLGALAADERLCAFLALATRFMPYSPLAGGGGVLTIELPRADIADLLGTSVETISRITHQMDAIGAIRILCPDRFEIPDLSRLIGMGCIEDSFDAIRFAASNPVWAQASGETGGVSHAQAALPRPSARRRAPDPDLPEVA